MLTEYKTYTNYNLDGIMSHITWYIGGGDGAEWVPWFVVSEGAYKILEPYGLSLYEDGDICGSASLGYTDEDMARITRELDARLLKETYKAYDKLCWEEAMLELEEEKKYGYSWYL